MIDERTASAVSMLTDCSPQRVQTSTGDVLDQHILAVQVKDLVHLVYSALFASADRTTKHGYLRMV